MNPREQPCPRPGVEWIPPGFYDALEEAYDEETGSVEETPRLLRVEAQCCPDCGAVPGEPHRRIASTGARLGVPPQ